LEMGAMAATKKKSSSSTNGVVDLGHLGTEQQNRSSANFDTKSALEIAQIINAEDAKVAAAVKRALPNVAKAIEAIAHALSNGGRLIYVGAGTSGRIAAIDASECPATFNADPHQVQYVMAGGPRALASAAEFNEDSRELGAADIAKRRPTRNDVIVGIAASGRTPYTIAAVEYAKSRGAVTVGISCNKDSQLGRVADIEIEVEVGPEVVSGSTRMKAGTAQKLVCNMLTTGAFTRLGYVYGNLMVNVHLKNKKLAERGINILMRATGVDRASAEKALKIASNHVPVALVSLKTGVTVMEAQQRLEAVQGNVRRAIEEMD
jgi:N-acetylmuramic acid 6-phosphate etherase